MKIFWKDGIPFVRVSLPDKRFRVVSCGTRDPETAKRVVAMLVRFRETKQWAPARAIIEKQATLAQIYDAHLTGTLDALLTKVADTDLAPLVSQWAASMRANGVETADKMARQVRSLIPARQRFGSSGLTLARVVEWRDSLGNSNSTKNRYRSALLLFVGWLLDREVLATDPLTRFKALPRNKVQLRYLRPEQFQRVVAAGSSARHRAILALLYGTGMEISAALRMTRADVDPKRKTVHAHGTKVESRDRECSVDAWAWPIFWEFARHALGTAPLFPYTGSLKTACETMNRNHRRLLKTLGLPLMRLHNTRHSFAIAARRRGAPDLWIARQLGHSDTTMVTRTYGNYEPDAVADKRRAK